MKKLLVILLVLLLSGCETQFSEEYYRNKVDTFDIELTIGVIAFVKTPLNNNERLVYVEFVEYYEEYQFEREKVYAFCINEDCEIITLNEYLEIKE